MPLRSIVVTKSNESSGKESTISANEYAGSISDIVKAGEAAALQLDNRGPVRYDANGEIHKDILRAY